ncbi:MAG TPA: hypothetical protein VMY37_27630 [Thermoguttaceae bacterium]|nr:hypothetical protein [Thermoguttaceae bacterium]
MRSRIAYGIALALSSTLAAGVCLAQDESELGKRLAALDHLRRGVNTPFEAIETECQQLLEQFPGAEDQGRIYAQLAHIYAQTGMRRPGDAQRVIDYAQKALQKPLDPLLRLRSYTYWGNAHVRSDPSDVMRSFFEGRAAAGAVYLKGLKEAQQYNIPEVAPERPAFDLLEALRSPDFERLRDAHYREVKRYQYERDLHMYRSALQGQLVFFYTRHPYAGSELRRLATEILGDAADVEKLMKLIPPHALKDEAPPKPK